MRSCDEILAEAKHKGLSLRQLFEKQVSIDDRAGNGQYQASFRHPNGWHDHGTGNSAAEALQDCLDRCRGLSGMENRSIPKTPPKVVAEEASLEDML